MFQCYRAILRHVGDGGLVAYNGATTVDPIISYFRSHSSVRILRGLSHHNLPSARSNDGGSC